MISEVSVLLEDIDLNIEAIQGQLKNEKRPMVRERMKGMILGLQIAIGCIDANIDNQSEVH